MNRGIKDLNLIRTDGVKSDVTWLLGGQFFQYKKSQSSLFILDNKK